MKNVEQELKLSLNEHEYGVLSDYSNKPYVKQTNYYFTCDNLPTTTMVRIREKQGNYFLCVKQLVSCQNNVNVCNEMDKEISPQFAKSLLSRGIYYHEINAIFSTKFTENLSCAGSMVTYRTKFQFENWTLELDKNEYLDTTDYELECENNQVESLVHLTSQLNYAFGIVAKPSQAKSKRFFDKLHATENKD